MLRLPIVIIAALLSATASPASAGDAAQGKAKAEACVTCHGLDGVSVTPDAPNISGQLERYMVEQLRAYRDGRRRHPVMSLIAKPLTNADIDDLAAWYSAIPVSVTLP